MPTTLILHERIGRWARMIRPRQHEWDVRLIESRSVDDLVSAASRSSCPMIVVDFRNQPAWPLVDLLRARRTAPSALILAIVTVPVEELGAIAIEAGATTSLTDQSPPSVVLTLIRRWIELSRRRSAPQGWAQDRVAEPEPWQLLLSDVARIVSSP